MTTNNKPGKPVVVVVVVVMNRNKLARSINATVLQALLMASCRCHRKEWIFKRLSSFATIDRFIGILGGRRNHTWNNCGIADFTTVLRTFGGDCVKWNWKRNKSPQQQRRKSEKERTRRSFFRSGGLIIVITLIQQPLAIYCLDLYSRTGE